MPNRPWRVPAQPLGATFAAYEMPATNAKVNVIPLLSSTGKTHSGSLIIEYRKNRMENNANDIEKAVICPMRFSIYPTVK